MPCRTENACVGDSLIAFSTLGGGFAVDPFDLFFVEIPSQRRALLALDDQRRWGALHASPTAVPAANSRAAAPVTFAESGLGTVHMRFDHCDVACGQLSHAV